MGFAQAALLSGMLIRVFTPRIVARGRYGSAVVVGGVATAVVAVRVVAVRVVAEVVSLFSGRGRGSVAALLLLGLASRPRLRVSIGVDRLAIDDSSTASWSSYCGLDIAEVCTAGVGLGVVLVGYTPRTLFTFCF